MKMIRQLRIAGTLVLISFAYHAHAQSCTVCPDGSAVTLINKPLVLPPPYQDIESCGALDGLVPFVLQQGSDECNVLNSVSTYCGCPEPENACQLCSGNDALVDPDLEVEFPPIPSEVITPNCGLVEAYLHSLGEEDALCASYKSDYESSCECSSDIFTGGGGNSPPPESVQVCNLCSDESPVGFPDKEIYYAVAQLVPPELAALVTSGDEDSEIVFTCQDLEAVLRSAVPLGDQTCNDAQGILAPVCGCPVTNNNPCIFCEAGVPDPDRLIYTTQDTGYPAAKCEDIQLYLTAVDNGSLLCKDTGLFEYLCDCEEEYYYLGSENHLQKVMITWVPRISGTLSILGSGFILFDVWRKRKNFSVFLELIACISFFDIFSSLGIGLSTLPIPEENEHGESNGIYGAMGSEWTCDLVGFMVQLGFTSILYQISLSTYYLMVIRLGWVESKIRSIAKWFHIPLIFGLGLAFAAIPFYQQNVWMCYIRRPRLDEPRTLSIIFNIIPTSISIAATSINMILVYLKVRGQYQTAQKWSLTARAANRQKTAGQILSDEVFWQSVLYLSAFYLSYSFIFASQFVKEVNEHYWFWILQAAITPLQGFFNFLIYIRPRLAKHMRDKAAERARNKVGNRSPAPNTGGTDEDISGSALLSKKLTLGSKLGSKFSKKGSSNDQLKPLPNAAKSSKTEETNSTLQKGSTMERNAGVDQILEESGDLDDSECPEETETNANRVGFTPSEAGAISFEDQNPSETDDSGSSPADISVGEKRMTDEGNHSSSNFVPANELVPKGTADVENTEEAGSEAPAVAESKDVDLEEEESSTVKEPVDTWSNE